MGAHWSGPCTSWPGSQSGGLPSIPHGHNTPSSTWEEPQLPLDRTPGQSLLSGVATPIPPPHRPSRKATAAQLVHEGRPILRGPSHSALRSPAGQLTMQGVGQHARHALHHHLVGGLQEGEGSGEPWQALSPACLWNWHSWGAKSSYGAQPETLQPPHGVSLPQVAPPVAHLQCPPPRSAAGSQARPHSS